MDIQRSQINKIKKYLGSDLFERLRSSIAMILNADQLKNKEAIEKAIRQVNRATLNAIFIEIQNEVGDLKAYTIVAIIIKAVKPKGVIQDNTAEALDDLFET